MELWTLLVSPELIKQSFCFLVEPIARDMSDNMMPNLCQTANMLICLHPGQTSRFWGLYITILSVYNICTWSFHMFVALNSLLVHCSGSKDDKAQVGAQQPNGGAIFLHFLLHVRVSWDQALRRIAPCKCLRGNFANLYSNCQKNYSTCSKQAVFATFCHQITFQGRDSAALY